MHEESITRYPGPKYRLLLQLECVPVGTKHDSLELAGRCLRWKTVGHPNTFALRFDPATQRYDFRFRFRNFDWWTRFRSASRSCGVNLV